MQCQLTHVNGEHLKGASLTCGGLADTGQIENRRVALRCMHGRTRPRNVPRASIANRRNPGLGKGMGSALIEACVAMVLLCSVGFLSAAAQRQALAMLTYAIEFQKAVWIASGAAESLRAGDSTEHVEREWGARIARAMDRGRVSIRDVSSSARVIEVSWYAHRVANRATCAHGDACVVILVGARRSTVEVP